MRIENHQLGIQNKFYVSVFMGNMFGLVQNIFSLLTMNKPPKIEGLNSDLSYEGLEIEDYFPD